MMYQLCHHRPIVYASVSRKLTETLSDFLNVWQVAEQKEALKEAHVKYIVVHTQLLSSTPLIDLPTLSLLALWDRNLPWRKLIAEYEQHYRTIYRDADMIVFQVYY